MAVLLDVDINVDYPKKPRALERVRFEVAERESVAVLGESGSGKSTLVLAILGLLDTTGARVSGRICFDGTDLLALSERGWRTIRGRQIAFVPQSAMSALNPALRIGSQMAEAWRVHANDRKNLWREQTLALFERVSLPASDDFLRRYPAQISIGQAQRVLIAMALLHRPRLLIADEPTSAVDPGTREAIRILLGEVAREFGIANLFITHDVAAVAGLCTRAVVLKQGKLLRTVAIDALPFEQAGAYTAALSELYADSTTGADLLGLAESLRTSSEAKLRREDNVTIE